MFWFRHPIDEPHYGWGWGGFFLFIIPESKSLYCMVPIRESSAGAPLLIAFQETTFAYLLDASAEFDFVSAEAMRRRSALQTTVLHQLIRGMSKYAN